MFMQFSTGSAGFSGKSLHSGAPRVEGLDAGLSRRGGSICSGTATPAADAG
jgi:hypothetical protein